MSEPRRHLGAGAALSVVVQGGPLIAGAVLSVVIARTIGPAGNGDFALRSPSPASRRWSRRSA